MAWVQGAHLGHGEWYGGGADFSPLPIVPQTTKHNAPRMLLAPFPQPHNGLCPPQGSEH